MSSDMAWAAGLLEGEGTFAIGKRPCPHAVLLCTMTDLDVLTHLHDLLGGTLAGPQWGKKSTKPFWVWQLSRRADLAPVLQQLLPWLGQRRGAKARLMLELIAEREAAKQTRLKPCGTRAKYERGCRCEPCIRARYWHNVEMKRKRRERAA